MRTRPQDLAEIVTLIEELTEEEGESITIPNPNPSFDGPSYMIEYQDDFGSGPVIEGRGESYLECLQAIKSQKGT